MYQGRRKVVYSNAAVSLETRPVRRQDATVKTFLKAEKINLSSKPDPAPRVIQPRDPRYNVEVGVFIKHLEHSIYHAVNAVFKETTIMKGSNAQQSGRIMHEKWSRFARPVAVGLDASRFDQHVSQDALSWEHSVYLQCFRGTDRNRLSELLRWQLVNKGVARASDGLVKYKVDGCRMSGDMNTGLGNCLIMCALVHAFCGHAGITKFSLANNGDDCVLFMEQSDLRKLDGLAQWFLEMGFTMKVEDPVYDLERVEFCQTHPIWTPQGYLMVRKHKVAMAKDCVSLVPLTCASSYNKWRHAVGTAGLSLTGGIPVQQEFYSCMLRGAVQGDVDKHPAMETGFARLAKGMDRDYAVVHPRTRYSYWLAFGVTPDAQCALEAIYQQIDLQYEPPCPAGYLVNPHYIAFSL